MPPEDNYRTYYIPQAAEETELEKEEKKQEYLKTAMMYYEEEVKDLLR